jgi:hypothetical protein
MSRRNQRRTWLLTIAILALALPEVAHGGGHRGGPHARHSSRGFERRDHRGRGSHARHGDRRVRHERSHVRHERRHLRSDRHHARSSRHYGGHRGGHGARHDRHGYRHRYPRYGHHVYRLPKHYVSISLGGHHHYYHHGVWYRPYRWGFGYVVATAPIGAVVSVLPPYYSTVWVYGVPYYYANYTYYRWSPPHDGYLVVEDPGVDAVDGVPVAAGGDELFVYPNAGQSEEQQADDRYACHSWAVEETGYDPSLVDPGDDESSLPGLRADYHRAMTACLEGRDYTVR